MTMTGWTRMCRVRRGWRSSWIDRWQRITRSFTKSWLKWIRKWRRDFIRTIGERSFGEWFYIFWSIDFLSTCKYVFGLEGNCISKVMFRLNWKIIDLNFRWNNFWYQKINIFFNFKRKKKNCCFMLINSKYNFFFY